MSGPTGWFIMKDALAVVKLEDHVVLDRRGERRCAGYFRWQFRPCELCVGEPSALCPACGGYGEVPETRSGIDTYVPEDAQ